MTLTSAGEGGALVTVTQTTSVPLPQATTATHSHVTSARSNHTRLAFIMAFPSLSRLVLASGSPCLHPAEPPAHSGRCRCQQTAHPAYHNNSRNPAAGLQPTGEFRMAISGARAIGRAHQKRVSLEHRRRYRTGAVEPARRTGQRWPDSGQCSVPYRKGRGRQRTRA